MDCPRCGAPLPEEEKNLCPYCFFLLGNLSSEGERKKPMEAEASLGSEKSEEKPTQSQSEVSGKTPYSLTMLPTVPSIEEDDVEVVDFFGAKLKLKRKGLAQILSMDIREVLTGNWIVVKRRDPATITAAVPTLNEEASMEEFTEYLSWAGQVFGFQVQKNLWESQSGRKIWIQPIIEEFSLEGAVRLIEGLLSSETKLIEPISFLLVAPSQAQAGVFKAAIVQREALHLINVIAFEDLRLLLALKESGCLSHQSVSTLLFPLAGLDIHQILEVVAEAVKTFPRIP